MAYTALNFVNDFIEYSKVNLNTLIDASNLDNGDTLLKQISTTTGYIYSNQEDIDQKRAEAIIIYDTPNAVRVDSVAFKYAMSREWNFGIAFAEGTRDTSLTNLNRMLRYEQCLQKLIENYFKRCGFATPEILSISYKDESTQESLYRYVVFKINFTIAGA